MSYYQEVRREHIHANCKLNRTSQACNKILIFAMPENLLPKHKSQVSMSPAFLHSAGQYAGATRLVQHLVLLSQSFLKVKTTLKTKYKGVDV